MPDSPICKLTWLGHATVRVDLPDGSVAVVDPWLTGNPSSPAGYEFERLELRPGTPSAWTSSLRSA